MCPQISLFNFFFFTFFFFDHWALNLFGPLEKKDDWNGHVALLTASLLRVELVPLPELVALPDCHQAAFQPQFPKNSASTDAEGVDWSLFVWKNHRRRTGRRL